MSRDDKIRDGKRIIIAEQSDDGNWKIEIWIGDLKIGSALTTNSEVNQSIADKQKRFNIDGADIKMKHARGRGGQIEIPFFMTPSKKPTKEQLLKEKEMNK